MEEEGEEAAPAAVEEAAPARAALTYDPAERAREKQASRDRDELDLASGKKTREQLARENSWFHGLRFRVDLAGAKRLY